MCVSVVQGSGFRVVCVCVYGCMGMGVWMYAYGCMDVWVTGVAKDARSENIPQPQVGYA